MSHLLPEIAIKKVDLDIEGQTFEQIKATIHASILKGHRFYCPACDQHAGISKRKITPEMASQLTRLCRMNIPMPSKALQTNVNGKSRMYSLLRHWGLIERTELDLWQITQKGRDFCDAQIKVAKYAYIYNDRPMLFSAEEVTLAECMASKFDLAEVFETEELDVKG